MAGSAIRSRFAGHAGRSARTRHAPRLKPGHSMGAGHRYWHTNAQGAADYLFNPVFMTFFILCVILYATLMQPSEETSLPVMAQIILWGGLIMTSLVWLALSAWLSVYAFDRGIVKAIYTPFILIPLVINNTVLGEFILGVFNESFQGSYGSIAENIIQNVIILAAFDVMHERFVAPQHPKYVQRRSGNVPAEDMVRPTEPDEPSKTPVPAATDAGEVLKKDLPVQVSSSDAAVPEVENFITISNERIETSELLWVRSEDHYLSVHMVSQNLMVRGKLRTVVTELGDDLGAQINRSAWVAFSAIRTMDEQANGVIEVHLEDDTVHRVANSRRLFFKQNYERFKAALACSEKTQPGP